MSAEIPEGLKAVINLLLAARDSNLVAALLETEAPDDAQRALERSRKFRHAAFSTAEDFIEQDVRRLWTLARAHSEQDPAQLPCVGGPCAGDSLRVAPGAELERVWLSSKGGRDSVKVSTTGEIPLFPTGDRPVGYYALNPAKSHWAWSPFALAANHSQVRH